MVPVKLLLLSILLVCSLGKFDELKGDVERKQWDHRAVLSEGLQLHIINPTAIIIVGRRHQFSQEQQKDFEVIQRQYKNVVDIMTYDDLIRRLEIIVEQLYKA